MAAITLMVTGHRCSPRVGRIHAGTGNSRLFAASSSAFRIHTCHGSTPRQECGGGAPDERGSDGDSPCPSRSGCSDSVIYPILSRRPSNEGVALPSRARPTRQLTRGEPPGARLGYALSSLKGDGEIADQGVCGGGALISDQDLTQWSGWFPSLFTRPCFDRVDRGCHRRPADVLHGKPDEDLVVG